MDVIYGKIARVLLDVSFSRVLRSIPGVLQSILVRIYIRLCHQYNFNKART